MTQENEFGLRLPVSDARNIERRIDDRAKSGYYDWDPEELEAVDEEHVEQFRERTWDFPYMRNCQVKSRIADPRAHDSFNYNINYGLHLKGEKSPIVSLVFLTETKEPRYMDTAGHPDPAISAIAASRPDRIKKDLTRFYPKQEDKVDEMITLLADGFDKKEFDDWWFTTDRIRF